MSPAQEDVTTLRGVGPSLADKLARLGIHCLMDVLLHLPSRYQDRTRVTPLRQLQANSEALVTGEVVESKITYGRRRGLAVTIHDGTGFLTVRLFHFAKSQQEGLAVGRFVRAFGEVRFYGTSLTMVHPEYATFDALPADPEPELTPVYPVTQGVTHFQLAQPCRLPLCQRAH